MDKLDLKDIPSEIVRSALLETVAKQIKSKKFRIKVDSASKAGENNFCGDVLRATIIEQDENENEVGPTLSLILKVAPQNPKRREKWRVRSAFVRENYMYDKVLPILRDFEKSRGLNEMDLFKNYPECYRIIGDEFNECIMLEDLTSRGFRTMNRSKEEITVNHAHLLFESLAKLHAISFALKDQQPERFEKLVLPLKEQFFQRDRKRLRDVMFKQSECCLDLVSGDTFLFQKLTEFYKRHPWDSLVDCIEPKAAGSAAVITHGDCWQNNLMFRCDKNGKPIEISLLDWQYSRYATPIIDILYIVFCNTTKEFRDAHYDELLEFYHNNLTVYIKRLGSDPEKLFPFDLMMEHFHKFGKFGLVLSTFMLRMMTLESGSGINLDEVSEKNSPLQLFVCEKSQSIFEKRLRDVVIDMVRLEYI